MNYLPWVVLWVEISILETKRLTYHNQNLNIAIKTSPYDFQRWTISKHDKLYIKSIKVSDQLNTVLKDLT